MENSVKNKTMPVGLAIILMVLIALAGGIAFYLQNKQKHEMLAEAEQLRLSQEAGVMAAYDRIEANLASIWEHESMITKDFAGHEMTGDMGPEEKIQSEINFIRHLIDENNKLIAGLNEQIDKKDSRIAGYEKSVKDLQARVSSYQVQLDQLVAEKAALQKDLDNTIMVKDKLATQVDKLGSEVVKKEQIIGEQQAMLVDKEYALHTAYYRVGSYKTLRDQNLLQKEGGFLGINRVTTLAGVPEKGLFQEIDTRDIMKIPVFAKRWEIVTGQDPSTYEAEYNDEGLVEWISIKDPEKFWGKSQYLVIVVRDDDFDELALYR